MAKFTNSFQKVSLASLMLAIAVNALNPTAAKAVDLVSNGDFNNGLTDWNVSGGTADPALSFLGLSSGVSAGNLNAVVLNTALPLPFVTNIANLTAVGTGYTGTFYHDPITTINGQNYTASFDLSNLATANLGSFQVLINGTTKIAANSFLTLGSKHVEFNFAGTGSDTLGFQFASSLAPAVNGLGLVTSANAAVFQLDNVAVTPTSVPEPFTVVGSLLGGTAAFQMRKKLKAAAKG